MESKEGESKQHKVPPVQDVLAAPIRGNLHLDLGNANPSVPLDALAEFIGGTTARDLEVKHMA